MKTVPLWTALFLIFSPTTAPAPIHGSFESLNGLIDRAEFVVVAEILERPEELDIGAGGIFEIVIIKVLKGDAKEGRKSTAYLRDLPFDIAPGKFTSLTHEFIKGQRYLLFLNPNKGQVAVDDKPVPVEFVNENSSGDAVWITQSSIYGYFDFKRLHGKSVREAIVALLTNTANQHRGIATAIEVIIQSRAADVLMPRLTQMLWFDQNAEEAVSFYLSIFRDAYKDPNGANYRNFIPGIKGEVTGVKFGIEGQEFVALNAGPESKSRNSNLLTLKCQTQEEIDDYWEKLSVGGEKSRGGWIKDKFGVSWHIVPWTLPMMLGGSDASVNRQRVIDAMVKMEKLDAAELHRAGRQE